MSLTVIDNFGGNTMLHRHMATKASSNLVFASAFGLVVACGAGASSENGTPGASSPEAAADPGAAPAVPTAPLDASSSPDAAGDARPLPYVSDNLLVITFPHGTRRVDSVPTIQGGTCKLPRLLEPLGKHQAKLSVIDDRRTPPRQRIGSAQLNARGRDDFRVAYRRRDDDGQAIRRSLHRREGVT